MLRFELQHEATLEALWVLAELRVRGLDGGCAEADELVRAHRSAFGDAFALEVFRAPRYPVENYAPEWLRPPDDDTNGPLVLLQSPCSAIRARDPEAPAPPVVP